MVASRRGTCKCKCPSSLLTPPGQVGKGCPCRASCALSIPGPCITSGTVGTSARIYEIEVDRRALADGQLDLRFQLRLYSTGNSFGQSAPKLIPFQGRLPDQTGLTVSNGVRLVQFKIYDVPTGGSPVWAGELHRTTVNGGLVNVTFVPKATMLPGSGISGLCNFRTVAPTGAMRLLEPVLQGQPANVIKMPDIARYQNQP